MSALITAYISIICASGVLNLILCVYAILKRHAYTSIANFFIAYALSITVYCFASATGLLATNLTEVKIWTIFQYIGIALSPAFGLLFMLKYLGFQMSKRIMTIIMMIPCITLIMVATNDFHHLHYRVYELDPVLGAPFVYQVEGFWYMIHGITSFAYMFIAALLACSRWKETNRVYRPQLITLIIGQTIPIIVIFFYLIDVTPRGVDPLPMTLWLTSALYLWCIKSSRLFAIMPIAKDTIFNHINDGVLVLDDSKNIIEYNAALQKMFPLIHKSMLGQNFIEIWKRLTKNYFMADFSKLPLTEEITIGDAGVIKTYQIRISHISSKKNHKGYLFIFTNITELKALQMKLEHQAYHDELTQIYNRRAFFQKCDVLLNASARKQQPFSILLIDLDHFKQINDTYGHQIGDEAIIHVVKLCEVILPKQALFARYGGEEFIVALQGFDKRASEQLANDLCAYVAAQTFAHEISVTISIGVAEVSIDNIGKLPLLLNQADKALYEAKEAGRNQVKVYEKALYAK